MDPRDVYAAGSRSSLSALVLAGALLFTATLASAAGSVSSKLSITAKYDARSGGYFISGKLKASKKVCAKRRLVKLYFTSLRSRDPGRRPGVRQVQRHVGDREELPGHAREVLRQGGQAQGREDDVQEREEQDHRRQGRQAGGLTSPTRRFMRSPLPTRERLGT
jgi:hypothetical protein